MIDTGRMENAVMRRAVEEYRGEFLDEQMDVLNASVPVIVNIRRDVEAILKRVDDVFPQDEFVYETDDTTFSAEAVFAGDESYIVADIAGEGFWVTFGFHGRYFSVIDVFQGKTDDLLKAEAFLKTHCTGIIRAFDDYCMDVIRTSGISV